MSTALFNRFEIELPDEAVDDCSHAGACDADVAYWAPKIPRPESVTPEALRDELREYGAWSTAELADDDANWRRIVWLASANIKEERYEASRKERAS